MTAAGCPHRHRRGRRRRPLPCRSARARASRAGRRRRAAPRASSAPLAGETLAWPSPIEDAFPAILARRGEPRLRAGERRSVLLRRRRAARATSSPPTRCVCLPAPSAFSLAAARLGWALQDCALVSLHGRPLERIVPHLQPGARMLALSWDGATPAQARRAAGARGFGGSRLTVLRGAGRPARAAAARRAPSDFDTATTSTPLNTVAIEVVAEPGARIAAARAGPAGRLVRARRPDHQARDPRPDAVRARAAARRAAVGHRRRLGLGRDRMDAAPIPPTRHRDRATPERAARIAPQRRWRSACPACRRRRRGARGAGRPAGAGCGLHRRRRAARGVVDAALGGAARRRAAGRQRGDARDPGRADRLLARAWRRADAGCRSRTPTRSAASRLAAGDAGHPMGGGKAMIASHRRRLPPRLPRRRRSWRWCAARGAREAGVADATRLFTHRRQARRGRPARSRGARSGLPLPVSAANAALRGAAARVVTRSARVERLVGVVASPRRRRWPAAGPDSRLLLPRIAGGGATCARRARGDA